MKQMFPVLIILLLSSPTFTEDTVVPAEKFNKQIQQEIEQLEQQETLLKIKEKRLELAERERRLTMRTNCFEKRSTQDIGGNVQRSRTNWWQRNKNRSLRIGKVLLGFILLGCAAITAVLHILLTILVYTDMKKHNKFNGLWISIILLGGLVTIIPYALMRNVPDTN